MVTAGWEWYDHPYIGLDLVEILGDLQFRWRREHTEGNGVLHVFPIYVSRF